ncbi:MAG: hypothetical protein R3C68_02440 [Myxococcota bacterium]
MNVNNDKAPAEGYIAGEKNFYAVGPDTIPRGEKPFSYEDCFKMADVNDKAYFKVKTSVGEPVNGFIKVTSTCFVSDALIK